MATGMALTMRAELANYECTARPPPVHAPAVRAQ